MGVAKQADQKTGGYLWTSWEFEAQAQKLRRPAPVASPKASQQATVVGHGKVT